MSALVEELLSVRAPPARTGSSYGNVDRNARDEGRARVSTLGRLPPQRAGGNGRGRTTRRRESGVVRSRSSLANRIERRET
jgi:hypothetical protein